MRFPKQYQADNALLLTQELVNMRALAARAMGVPPSLTVQQVVDALHERMGRAGAAARVFFLLSSLSLSPSLPRSAVHVALLWPVLC